MTLLMKFFVVQRNVTKVFSTLTVVTSPLMIGANPASAKTSSISEQSLIKWSW